MALDLVIFFTALFFVIHSASHATRYASRVAASFRLSHYLVGFLVVAGVSVLPETFIALNAAFAGVPSFGLGTLFGSNVADLTVVFATIIFITGRGITVESKVISNTKFYPLFLFLPLALGFDGWYSRYEGAALIATGIIFYTMIIRRNLGRMPSTLAALSVRDGRKNIFFLIASMVVLLGASHITVDSASRLARDLGVSPILVGMLIVGLGTTMPELFFSLTSHKKHDDSLAVGDILGTVMTDATIVVGILALVQPFAFPRTMIFSTGVSMLAACLVLLWCMRTGRALSKREAAALVACYAAFVCIEYIVNT